MYDYLIVGAGLFGATFAHEAKKAGKKCLVIDRRNHIAGNIYTEKMQEINVHKYGAHIFHTDNKEVWDYINQFATFNRYTNEPVAVYKNETYNLPFNMNTFSKMWGIRTPQEAKEIIEKQRTQANISQPQNLEEQALSMVGRDIYEKLIKGYTEKQWGKDCVELPAYIIKRLPVRFVYDNNYFNDRYQGIPEGGYTQIIEKMLKDIPVMLETDYNVNKNELKKQANRVLYTGMIDEYFGYCFGELEYRSLNFETKTLDIDNYQGNAVINYTEREIPYTRIIEHKHFEFLCQKGEAKDKTVITVEYPANWQRGLESYYPIDNSQNREKYLKYYELAKKENKIIFGGRLGLYKYFDMDDTIEAALKLVREELK